MIKRIKINGYKSFQNLDLHLKPLTVIFGPNASGKSNFLDAIHLLSRVVSGKNLNEAFREHRGLPLESFQHGETEFSFEVDVEISAPVREKVERLILEKRKGIDSPKPDKKIITEKWLRYHLTVEILVETGHLRVKDESLYAVKSNGDKKMRNAFLQQDGEKKRLLLRMEGRSQPTYYEIGLDHTIVSTPLYEPHYPHITAFRMELANWYTYYLEPRELMREELPRAEIETLGSRGENLAPFLNTLKYKYKKDYDNLNRSLRMILPSKPTLDITQSKEGMVGLSLKENGHWFSSRLISEGTLRLIGLLCSIHPRNPATTVAFEEPENGVHPVRLKLISDLLKNASQQYQKQVIVITHSPILSQCFAADDLFICRKDGTGTTITQFSPNSKKIHKGLEDKILRGDFGG